MHPLLLAIAALAVASTSFAQQTTLISTGALWRYLDTGVDQGTAWRSPSFDDSTWPFGPAELGFGDGGESTTNTAGFGTYYYRHTFLMGDASSITNLRARLKRDDGAVVYLNGVEVFRSNMSTGEITSASLAATTAADDGTLFFPSSVNAALLVNGNNVIAVEVHQAATNSSDVSFDFELMANPLPSISISSPTNGQLITGTSVIISGAGIAGGSNVTLVEVFQGATKVGEATNANYTIAWGNVAPGSYTVTARVTDSSGLRATSAPVDITVQAPPTGLLIARGSSWKYHNLNQDLSTSWQGTNYDDSGWLSGVAPLGDNVEGGVQQCSTVIDIGPSGARYPTLYYRKNVMVSGASAYQSLTLRLQRDDGAAVYLNGVLLTADGVAVPSIFGAFATQTTAGADEVAYREYTVPPTALVNGTNVFAVENKQVSVGSSDLQFDLEVEGQVDLTAPVLTSTSPAQGSIVLSLTFINVGFNESVIGVNASDLLINSAPATSVVTNNPNDYTFYFTQPATGLVQVAFAPDHGITDASALANSFGGGNWSYTLNPNASTYPNVVISEFMADNNNGIKDDDGTRQDWLELYNLGPLDANLDGWFLTDTATNLTKWRIPGVPLSANKYLLIWASSKDRSNPSAPLHTNFKIAKSGGFIALVNPQTNIVSSFNPYPAQQTDVSYGRDRVDPSLVGFFATPTPGAQNSTTGAGFTSEPAFSLQTGIYTNSSLTLTLSNPAGAGTIRYTLDQSLPATNSLLYTGAITFSINMTIKARIFPPAGSNVFPSAVGMRTFVFLDNTTTNFSSSLPMLIISTEGRAIPQDVPPGGSRAPGSFVVIDNTQGRSSVASTPQFHGLAVFEIFGQTSAGFAKKPIRIEIQDAVGNDLDVPLLGMPADSDWRLRNPYDDKSFLNDYLGFEMWEDMGHYSVRRRLVEVFLNGSVNGGLVSSSGRLNYAANYYGIMVLVETIKAGSHRVDVPKISPYNTNEPTVTGGYIFKKDKDSVGDLNFSTTGGAGFSGETLKLHQPKVNDLRLPSLSGVTTTFPGAGYTAAGTNQLTYLRGYLNAMERAMYTNTWLTQTGTNHYSYYMDLDRFVDQHWHVEFTKQIDGYRLSDYFTKDRLGKVGPGPVWDWNLAWGNADYATGGMTNGWYYEVTDDNGHIWQRRLMSGTTSATGTTGDPDYTQRIADRWSVLRTNILNGTNVIQHIDQLATSINEPAKRDIARYNVFGIYVWPNPSGAGDGRDVDYVRPLNYLGPIETVAPSTASGSIIGQMKKWVLGRYLWIDSQFTRRPSISASDAMVTNGYTVTVTPPPGAILYYTLNGTDPRAPGGTVAAGASSNSGPVTITVNANMRIVARALRTGAWKNTFSGPNAVSLYTVVPSLRITEIMYHPAPPPSGSTNSSEDFEYVEVKNIGAVPLDVNGYSLGGGVQFTFPNASLAAGQSAVVVANIAAFQSRYGTNILILGAYTGSLNDAGDHVVLSGSLLESILDFSYADNWYPATDGGGFSLVVVNENAAASAWDTAANWRASAALGGSPGATDPAAPIFPIVVVNEVLANEALAFGDAIELRNTSGTPADISGWFLTDNFDKPKKFVIPPATVIPASGFVVFYETNSFGATNAYTANGTNSFGLGAKGDDAYLFSGDGVNLTGYAHGFDFGASASNSTIGRYVISTGADHFVVQRSNTLGSINAGPLVGPIVVNEINYHPSDLGINGIAFNNIDDEFIELHNLAGSPVPLYDPAYPANTWHLRSAVDYDFPPNVTLPAGGYLLVVGFDPVASPGTLASFRNNNFVPTNIPVFGPWTGSLDNNSARVELNQPDVPETNGSVPYILVERVGYSDTTPWPAGADGFGLTLQRIVPGSYGNDPTNWTAAAATPGADFVGGGVAPVITSQPASQTVLFGSGVTLTATATGSAPLRYQWRFNGFNLAGATSNSLVVSNFQAAQVGTYNIFIYNSGGYALGTNFTLSGRTGLRITLQPVDRSSLPGLTNTFTVAAVGTGTLRYQWRKDGTNLIGVVTNATLTITNTQVGNQGVYTCLVSDDVESILSNPAMLTVVFKPAYTLNPIAQTVVEGGTVNFSVAASGTPPMNFRWRSNGVTFVPANPPFTSNTVYYNNGLIVNGPTNSTLILTNVGMNYNGAPFSVVITNIAGSATGVKTVVLTVLADTDHDGLPDSWETSHAGFNPNDPSDGALDNDGDGMSNAAEYFAGTDPFDASSYLKVNLTVPGQVTVNFNAVSNRTYTVQYTDSLTPPLWQKLGDALSRTNTRNEVFVDPSANTNRYYRLVIPIRP